MQRFKLGLQVFVQLLRGGATKYIFDFPSQPTSNFMMGFCFLGEYSLIINT